MERTEELELKLLRSETALFVLRKEARWYPLALMVCAVGALIAGVWLGSVLEMERTWTNCSKYGETVLSSRAFTKTLKLDCLPKAEKPSAPLRKPFRRTS